MERAQKRQVVSDLNEVFNSASLVVVTHYSGLNVADMSELRARMREAGATFKVTKNRLTKLALDGTPYSQIAPLFTGPTAIAYSDDLVAPAKVVVEFAKKNEFLVVIGGAMGTAELDVDGVKALAALPSLDESRASLIALLNAPATKIAGVLQAPAAQLARVMAAQGAKEEAA